MSGKIDRLLVTRERISGDMKHHIRAAKLFDQNTNPTLIAFKDKALDVAFEALLKNRNSLDGHTYDNSAVVQAENRALEDDYHVAKAHLATLQPEREVDMNASYIPHPQYDSEESAPSTFKLPMIQIPPFNGKLEQWTEFKDLFESLIAKQAKLEGVQKLHYLKNALVGEPLQLIKHLTITNDNYIAAWQILKDRYENKRALITSHLKNLYDITPVTANSASSLRNVIDTVNVSLSALDLHGVGTMFWDELIVYHITRKLDPDTLRHWEEELKGSKEFPKLERLRTFLEVRHNVMQNLQSNKPPSKPRIPTVNKTFVSQEKTYTCAICNEGHRNFQCPNLNRASLAERFKIVEEKGLCRNCLFQHNGECSSKFRCRKCDGTHHTLLHRQISNGPQRNTDFSGHLVNNANVILATALIPVRVAEGHTVYLRALLDQGSTTNIITESAVQLIQAVKVPSHNLIVSIGDTQTGCIKHKVEMQLKSLHHVGFTHLIEAAVVPKLTRVGNLSASPDITHIKDLNLADPNFTKAGRIDLLLGAPTVADILLPGLIKGPAGTPVAQNTELGWVIFGSSHNARRSNPIIKCNLTKIEDNAISQQLKQFWEIEDGTLAYSSEPVLNESETKFLEGISRAEDGKFMVKLPFKTDHNHPDFLGESWSSARKRFFALEKKLTQNENVQQAYSDCMNEYLQLNHMRIATFEEEQSRNGYYLPHHAVVKADSTTTKIRVVYDASCKTSNGYSLNDRLLVGPTIQPPLFAHLINWRLGKIALAADLEKMYRMVWVHPDHVKFQKILWRNNPKEPLRTYVVLCLLFGTASAAYQAIRVLFHIADQIKVTDPFTAQLIKKRFYVDDFLCTADSHEQAREIQESMTRTLANYGFKLRKWISNSPKVLQVIPIEEQEKTVTLNTDAHSKTLGTIWKPAQDTLGFRLKLPEDCIMITKRKILSEVSQLFDPLGILSPTIVKAKMLLQELWSSSAGWDDSLSSEIEKKWIAIRSDLFNCEKIKFNRWIGIPGTYKSCTLHGFADASQKAYAAVVYCRTENLDGSVIVNLVASKTKVAPLQSITLPRLELCAAHLLVKLLKTVRQSMEIETITMFGYTDSEITLAWIKGDLQKWKTFVANRVAEIHRTLEPERWHHVRSKLNPADCASRGINLIELGNHPLWWHGPSFLQTENYATERALQITAEDLPEQRKWKEACLNIALVEENPILIRFSSLSRLIRTTAYCFRWPRHKCSSAELTTDEIQKSLEYWVLQVQQLHFNAEIQLLRKGQMLPSNNRLASLCPFIDHHGLLRVTGRLQNAALPIDQKHPFILSNKSHLSRLIILDAHQKTMHSGCQNTLSYLRQRFWLIRGKNAVKAQINRCVVCLRYKRQTLSQQMGQLPTVRVQANRPFHNVGIDFAGYFEIKTSIKRNAAFTKCYIALFICMATKAIHLELVNDLSTNAFLSALRRFTARRGIPQQIFSDRGTNFIGANNELPRLLQDSCNPSTREVLLNLTNHSIQWNFNPARSPHFGGLWEAGVRSTKYHLKRILQGTKLNYENFNTLLCQIEACLNSRPLCPLSDEIETLDVLTPGHFLIGQALNTIPGPSLMEINLNHLNQYQYLQRLLQEFWKTWSKEYLHRLQTRPKWVQKRPNIEPDQIVIIQEDNLPPAQWLLGRVTKVFPGRDGLVRVAEVRCRNSTVRRPIHKLCLLPIVEPVQPPGLCSVPEKENKNEN